MLWGGIDVCPTKIKQLEKTMATIEHKPSEINPSLEALKNIGTQIRLPSNIDPSYRMSDYIRQSYHVLDLIPCHPLISLSSQTQNQKLVLKLIMNLLLNYINLYVKNTV